MRVNIYAEELTDRVELITKTIEGHEYVAVRFYMELPCTIPGERWQDGYGDPVGPASTRNVRGPFMHRPGDDDSAAVTFWGKQDLKEILLKAIVLIEGHYAGKAAR
jgi:hypothetical protein